MIRLALVTVCAAAVAGVAAAAPPQLLHPASLHAKAPAWQNATIKDDPVKASNTLGTITYADAGPDTRSTQVFVNLGNNAPLDSRGFSPFGRVTSGMGVVDRLYGGYGDQPTNDQQQISSQGNAFLRKHFPKLDSIVTARLSG